MIYPALVAGVLAGLLLFVLQRWTTLPLIHQAERYETTAEAVHPPPPADGAPEDGLARAAYTAAGDVLVAIGFGMLLTGMYALSGRYGLGAGVLWGLAGFATFHLGPAAVVPPSIPALALAPLPLRQAAWLAAAFTTGLGLAIFAFGPGVARFAGLLLLLLPGVLAGLFLPVSGGRPPARALAGLEHLFVVRALGDSFLFWLVLGALTGHLFERAADLHNGADPA